MQAIYPRQILFSFMTAILIFLSACTPTGETLPLAKTPYQHPSGVFSLPYPNSWVIEETALPQAVKMHPAGDSPDISVLLIGERLPGETEDEMNQNAQKRLGEIMTAFLPYQDYEIVNNGELRVDRQPAILLDLARPMNGSFHLVRLVMVYVPGHLVILTGFGPREDWEAFLPTFREMTDGITFSITSFPLNAEEP